MPMTMMLQIPEILKNLINDTTENRNVYLCCVRYSTNQSLNTRHGDQGLTAPSIAQRAVC